jgi:alpha-beta hydrolase superfamily lysophospholipase
MKKQTKRRIVVSIGILSALVGLFVIGPRPKVSEQLSDLELPSGLESYLRKSEARYPDIKPGTEKTIIWAHPSTKGQTVASVVYLHGFSASRQETAPLSEQIAARLAANLFYTRLRGHGRSGDALGEVTVNDWLNDAQEAMEIGKRLGNRVVLLGSSTGATLAAWMALQPQWQPHILAVVLISPNFGPRDTGAEVLLWPWGVQMIRLAVGKTRSFTPANEGHATYWTTRYPVKALSPMMGLVQLVRSKDLSQIKTPTLTIYSKADQVVDSRKVEMFFEMLGSRQKKLLDVMSEDNPSQHVLAGDILSPSTTDRLTEDIVRFVAPLKKSGRPLTQK